MANPDQSKPTGAADFQGINRRATVRYRSTQANTGRAFLANSSKSLDAVVADLSLGGIGLILGSFVEPGTLVRIELGRSGKEILVDRMAQIANTTQLENDRWRCGCEWIHHLTEEEMLLLR